MPEHTPAAPDDRDPWRAVVRQSALPVGVVDLNTRTFVDLSDPAREALGLVDADVTKLDVASLSVHPDATAQALAFVRDRKLDGYVAACPLRAVDGRTIDSRLSLTAIDVNGRRDLAICLITSPDTPASTDAQMRSDRRGLTVGSIGADGTIDRISTDCEDLLGIVGRDLVGLEMLGVIHADDVEMARAAFDRAASDETMVSIVLRVAARDGTWERVRVSVAPEGERVGFTLAPGAVDAEPAGNRLADLERRLWRIAQELEDAGVIPTMGRLPGPSALPGLEDLSARQWEVIHRLLRGERVETMARAMFLSTSTIRNHLSTIYRKVGVHSQAELMEWLRDTDEA